MAMTESEAKKHLELCKTSRMFIPKNDVLNMAIKALEEVQAYRAIGTVEELKTLKECVDCSATVRWIDKNRISVNDMEFVSVRALNSDWNM